MASMDSVLAPPPLSGAVRCVIVAPPSDTGTQISFIIDSTSTHDDSSATLELNKSDYISINSSSSNNSYSFSFHTLEPIVVRTPIFTLCRYVKSVLFYTDTIKGAPLRPTTQNLPKQNII